MKLNETFHINIVMCMVTNGFFFVSATDAKGKGLTYSSYTDCILKSYKKEGAGAFVKGFGSMFIKIGPHTILCLVFWDGLKHLHENYWKHSSQLLAKFVN